MNVRKVISHTPFHKETNKQTTKERHGTVGINIAREFKERSYRVPQGLRLEFKLGLGLQLRLKKRISVNVNVPCKSVTFLAVFSWAH